MCIHVEDFVDKFNFLALSARKLAALVVGECAPESADSPSNMEVLTSGHLFSLVVKVSTHSLVVVRQPVIAEELLFSAPTNLFVWGDHNLCCVFFFQILPNIHFLLHFLSNILVLRKNCYLSQRAISELLTRYIRKCFTKEEAEVQKYCAFPEFLKLYPNYIAYYQVKGRKFSIKHLLLAH